MSKTQSLLKRAAHVVNALFTAYHGTDTFFTMVFLIIALFSDSDTARVVVPVGLIGMGVFEGLRSIRNELDNQAARLDMLSNMFGHSLDVDLELINNFKELLHRNEGIYVDRNK